MGSKLTSAFALAVASVCLCTLAVSCDSGDPESDAGGAPTPEDASPYPDVPQLDASTFAQAPSLSLDAVTPGRGTADGGRPATLRGSGFDAGEVTVTFGGVAALDAMLVDAHRVEVIVPPGSVGPVDVAITVGDESTELADAYVYDALRIDPPVGSAAGGTLVTIETAAVAFDAGDSVTIAGASCTDVTVVSTTQLTCRTPPGSEGAADVRVAHSDGRESTAPEAFRYVERLVEGGGLDGGPIAGELEVLVFDWATSTPIEDAFVLVNEDLDTPLQGRTDAGGRLSLSAPGLVGPVNVHIAKPCYQTSSFVGFDAQVVTALLTPVSTPECGAGLPPPGRIGTEGAWVSGELIWAGAGEGPNPWSNVPEPLPGEVRVAYLYTTRACMNCGNPDPASDGAIQRVVESEPGTRGYPYRISTRHGGLAIYAFAGTEVEATGQFTPFVMGIAGGVNVAPGGEREEVDVEMDIPLDRFVDVEVTGLPEVVGPDRPDHLRVSAFPVVGEGWITFDGRERMTSPFATTFRFAPTPPLEGALIDAVYDVEVEWAVGEYASQPSTRRRLFGVRPTDAPISVDGFLGIAEPVAPLRGEALPADRVLRWTASGPTPDLTMVYLISPADGAGWRAFVRGDLTAAPIPDLSAVAGIEDLPAGFVAWFVLSMRVPGADFDRMRYSDLNASRQSHSATSDGFGAWR